MGRQGGRGTRPQLPPGVEEIRINSNENPLGPGKVALELGVDHTWTQSAWLDTIPRLSVDPDGGPGYVLVKLFDQGST